MIGLVSLALLVVWDRIKPLKRSPFPAPLVVVLLGVGLGLLFGSSAAPGRSEPSHLVQVPVAEQPGRVLELSADARLLSVVEPGDLHRRR